MALSARQASRVGTADKVIINDNLQAMPDTY